MSAADIDGWRHELMVSLFMGDDEELQTLIRDHLILPYLFGDFHPSHIQEGLLIALRNRQTLTVLLVVSGPSFAAKAGGSVSPTSPPQLSGVLFLKYSHLHTKVFCRQQVSWMAPPTGLITYLNVHQLP